MGAEKLESILPFWPAGMNRTMALAYTGVSEVQLREWERAKKVGFRRRGPNGAFICQRADLDAALAELFSDNSEDYDFGD